MSSTVLTGNPAGPFVGNASCVDAGFPVTSTSIKVPFQGVLDDAAFLNADKLSKSLGGTVAGAVKFARTRYRDPARFVDGLSHIASCAVSNHFILVPPSGTPTIELLQSSDAGIADGDWMEFQMPVGATPGAYYEVIREGSMNFICRFDGLIGGSTASGTLRVHVESGVWRLTGGAGLGTIGSDA